MYSQVLINSSDSEEGEGYQREVTDLLGQLIALLLHRQQLLAQVLERLAGLPLYICDLHMSHKTSHFEMVPLLTENNASYLLTTAGSSLKCASWKGTVMLLIHL